MAGMCLRGRKIWSQLSLRSAKLRCILKACSTPLPTPLGQSLLARRREEAMMIMRHTCTKMQALEIFISWLADKSEAPALKLLCQPLALNEEKWSAPCCRLLVLGKKLSNCQQTIWWMRMRSASGGSASVSGNCGCVHFPDGFACWSPPAPPHLPDWCRQRKSTRPEPEKRAKVKIYARRKCWHRVHGDDVFKYFMSSKMRINIWVPRRVAVSQRVSLAQLPATSKNSWDFIEFIRSKVKREY